jgi:molybdopterin synthase catalytic subunit
MQVELREAPFDPWAELASYEGQGLRGSGRYGAIAVFVGAMRDFSSGDAVLSMTLEHYPGMTEAYLARLASAARERWGLLDCLVLHRVGALAPGDPIVLVAAWSAHRAEALEACRYLIEELKHRAPFWKKEQLADRSRWVEGNT